MTEKTTAAAAAADAGVVFCKYGATGINSVQHYQEQARAASGFSRIRWRARAETVTKTESTLCSARGELFLRCTDAEGGRERPAGRA